MRFVTFLRRLCKLKEAGPRVHTIASHLSVLVTSWYKLVCRSSIVVSTRITRACFFVVDAACLLSIRKQWSLQCNHVNRLFVGTSRMRAAYSHTNWSWVNRWRFHDDPFRVRFRGVCVLWRGAPEAKCGGKLFFLTSTGRCATRTIFCSWQSNNTATVTRWILLHFIVSCLCCMCQLLITSSVLAVVHSACSQSVERVNCKSPIFCV